jgi:hypothetical protein
MEVVKDRVRADDIDVVPLGYRRPSVECGFTGRSVYLRLGDRA